MMMLTDLGFAFPDLLFIILLREVLAGRNCPILGEPVPQMIFAIALPPGPQSRGCIMRLRHMEELATGVEDWWARGIGIGAFAVAAVALLWRVIEWRVERRLNLRVRGSAGGLIGAGQTLHLARSTRVAYSLVVVDVVNIGRSPAWVERVGFHEPVPLRERISDWWHNEIRDEDVESRRRILQITPDPASGSGVVPSRLEPGQRLVVFGNPSGLQTEKGIAKFYPFCEDAEGHIHKGKNDRHFRRLLKAASAKPGNTPAPDRR